MSDELSDEDIQRMTVRLLAGYQPAVPTERPTL